MTLLHPSVQVQELYPIGSIIEATCPPSDNWLKLEGQLLSRSAYSELLNALDTDNPYAWNFSWVERNLGTRFDSSGIIRMKGNGSYWVGVGEDGDAIKTTDGETFTDRALPNTTPSYQCIAWNGSVWLAIGYNTTASATSSDGESWTSRTMPTTKDWEDLIWDGTYFIPVANDDTQCRRSTDGITWNNAGTFPVGANSIATNGSGTTLAFRASNATVMRTTDSGSNWSICFYPPGSMSFGANYGWILSYANGYFFLCPLNDRGYNFISSDGLEWDMIFYAQFENIGNEIFSDWTPQERNYSGYSWFYCKDQWFALPAGNGSTIGVRSPDLKRFYPWMIQMGDQGYKQSLGYNSTSGKIFMLDTWYRYVTYCEEYIFDETTYFQLPRQSTDQIGVTNRHHFIRAK